MALRSIGVPESLIPEMVSQPGRGIYKDRGAQISISPEQALRCSHLNFPYDHISRLFFDRWERSVILFTLKKDIREWSSESDYCWLGSRSMKRPCVG
jgi:hypothetical protein